MLRLPSPIPPPSLCETPMKRSSANQASPTMVAATDAVWVYDKALAQTGPPGCIDKALLQAVFTESGGCRPRFLLLPSRRRQFCNPLLIKQFQRWWPPRRPSGCIDERSASGGLMLWLPSPIPSFSVYCLLNCW